MDPKAGAVRQFIDQIYREGVVPAAVGSPRVIRPIALTRERGTFLGDLCRREGARATLEIGMAWGLSTLFILEALVANQAGPGAHVVIDPFQTAQFDRAALASVDALGLGPMIEFHEEFSEFQLPLLIKQGRVFDLIFIDGSHRFDGVFLDLVFADRLLRAGGVMVFDDTWSDPVFLACRFLATNYGYVDIGVAPTMRSGRRRKRLYRGGIRAYRKPSAPPTGGEHDFIPFHEGIDFRCGEERRWRATAIRALAAGDRPAARRALRAALELNPRRLQNYLRWLRTYLPGNHHRDPV
jgi:predicted O-methyltransferase YrrM